MLFDDSYRTIETPAEGLYRERGSKFLAFAYPVTGEEDLKNYITSLKQDHPKANHHCWALRLTPDRSVFRFNDDGEPSGTAGRPILNTLLSHDLTNIAVIVVRYFGGTLLGVPGLINAYKTAAEESIKQSTIIEKTVNDVYILQFDYLQTNDIMRLIKDDSLQILEQQFDNKCEIQVSIRKTQVNRTLDKAGKIPGVIARYKYTI
ncbi:MAG TPA: YigZ family protein [Mucilaginibacter sp.]|nr:YigZ family protein [Mucilaginibacter sp.]